MSPDQQRISTELVDSMREKIREALQADKVDISDTYGDGRHVSIDVVSKAFEGESSMKRCGMVVTAWHACMPISKVHRSVSLTHNLHSPQAAHGVQSNLAGAPRHRACRGCHDNQNA